MRTLYRIDDFQETYFVIDGFEDLLNLAKIDFEPVYQRINGQPEFQPGDILLHRFSPTGFYSSAVRNPFLRSLEARSERQIAFSGEAAGDNEMERSAVDVNDSALALIQEGLRGVVRIPTGTAHTLDSSVFPIPVMGKTGTTTEFRDALFVGSTFGLEGITVAAAPRQMELVPYVTSRSKLQRAAPGDPFPGGDVPVPRVHRGDLERARVVVALGEEHLLAQDVPALGGVPGDHAAADAAMSRGSSSATRSRSSWSSTS